MTEKKDPAKESNFQQAAPRQSDSRQTRKVPANLTDQEIGYGFARGGSWGYGMWALPKSNKQPPVTTPSTTATAGSGRG